MVQYKYPGINVDLKDPPSPWEREQGGGYDVWDDYDETPLPIRELFMMNLMDKLTDKPDWNKKVFDETIVAKWRAEALAQSEKELFDLIVHKTRKPLSYHDDDEDNTEGGSDRYTQRLGYTFTTTVPFPRSRILSEEAFDFCIRELRTKAAYLERTGLVPTLDAMQRAVVKSDLAVGEGLKTRLRDIFAQLRADQVSKGLDWHPRTDEMVLDLVHPSLYPFVYGRSLFIQDEAVGVSDAIDAWAGKGQIAPAEATLATSANSDQFWRTNLAAGSDWSAKYQWLPSNVGLQGGSARFTSYINNLHPKKYANVYRAVEELIDLAIPAWDQALGDYGRQDSRFSIPEEANDAETPGLWEELDPDLVAACPLQPGSRELRSIALKYDWPDEGKVESTWTRYTDDIDNWKWEKIRDAILPEPDNRAEVDYTCNESIRDTCKDTGLQIYVKFARIELTPEKPDFPAGGWHVEGMVNERICATALYYLDSENITTSSLDFRMRTEQDQTKLRRISGQDAFNWLERVYGVNLRDDSNLQYYGRVETREGRMLAFPNSFQHRVTPFSLKDRSKPGHRSFVALWLVDPGQRVVSTANVPPQQLDWWTEAVFGGDNANYGNMPPEILQLFLENPELAKKLPSNAKEHAKNVRLPNELYDMLRKESGVLSGLMSLDEAKEHRLRLMDERTVYSTDVDNAQDVETYSFCEH